MNYLIAVGGTGQHVALALVDYLALALHATPPNSKLFSAGWQIVMLDADSEAGDAEKSAWALAQEQCRRLHDAGLVITRNQFRPVDDKKLGTGDTPLALLMNELDDQDARKHIPRLLFTSDQLALKLNQGFWGEPRVASFFGRRWLQQAQANRDNPLHSIVGALGGQSVPQIVITGSVVGGTGAGLLEPLRATMSRAKEHLLVSAGMQWFTVEGERGEELTERMLHNASSCLLPFLAESDDTGLNVWGHPQLEGAMPEADSDDRMQPAKLNLTLPWTAAANIVTFFIEPDECPRQFTNAGRANSVLAVHTPAHTIRQLVEDNRTIIARLTLVSAYLAHGYRGHALLKVGDIAALDRVANKDALKNKVDQTIAAKAAALERLGVSEDRNPSRPPLTISPPRLTGVNTIRQLTGDTPDVKNYGHQSVRRLHEQESTTRLLPPRVMAHVLAHGNPPPGKLEGSITALGDSERGALADRTAIAATKIPSIDGVRMLMEVFLRDATRTGPDAVAGDRLTEEDEVTPRRTPARKSTTEDHDSDWMRRWFLVLRAMVSGAVTRRDLPISSRMCDELARTGIKTERGTGAKASVARDLLFYGSGVDEYVIGYLDPVFLVVPSVGEFWEDQERVDDLGTVCGGVSLLFSWLLLLKKYRLSAGPPWLNYVLGQLNANLATREVYVASSSISIAYGDGVLDLPLPAARGNQYYRDFLAGAPDPRDVARWQKQLDALSIGGQYIHEELQRTFGDDYYQGRVHSISVGQSVVQESDVFTPAILKLDCGLGYSIPVAARFASVLDRWAITESTREVSVKLRLRRESNEVVEIQRTYPRQAPAQVKSGDDLLLAVYFAPKTVSPSTTTTWVLAEGKSLVKRWTALVWAAERISLPAGENGTWSGVVTQPLSVDDWQPLQPINRLRRVVSAQSRQFSFLAYRQSADGEDECEMGLIPYGAVLGRLDTNSERWAVDFGTSSTVIACEQDHRPAIVRLDRLHDSTLPAVRGADCKIAASELRWWPTWDGLAPIEAPLEAELGSHVLSLKDAAAVPSSPELGVDYVEDLGWTISQDSIAQMRVRYTKWGDDPLRTAFNRDVLELALAARLAATKSIPAQLEIVFTVPYRQLARIESFRSAILQAIAQVRASFGTAITPKFAWESSALRPEVINFDGQVYVAADLGGGTLDLYAIQYASDEAGYRMTGSAVIDSAQVGADCLVNAWGRSQTFDTYLGTQTDDANRTAVIKSAVKAGRITVATWEAANKLDCTKDYWISLRKYIDVWVRSVLKHWHMSVTGPVHIERLGLGWKLFDEVPPGGKSFVSLLNDRKADLTYTERMGDRENRSGKAELAYRALRLPPEGTSRSIEELKARMDAGIIFGVDCVDGKRLCPASSLLDEADPHQLILADRTSVRDLFRLSEPGVANAVRRMNRDVSERGAVIDLGERKMLTISPLTLIVEETVWEKVGTLPVTEPRMV